MEFVLKFIYIFLARMTDVSLGSLRIIFIGKGKPKLAFLFAFIEVFIWFMVAKDVLSGGEWYCVFPYALGYATGTFIGIKINEKFVNGNLGVQVVTSSQNEELIDALRNRGYAVSVVDVHGIDKKKSKYMLFIEINKKKFKELKELIKEVDSKAFIVVNETRYVMNGYFK